ncbi:MAG: VCBS domain-containing protein, partial [Desulfohalobiaceae bacterium]|nr:VCBS domain-containing protein [Desulfohalobiaceae bacterium]
MPETSGSTKSIGEVVAVRGTAEAVSEDGVRTLESGDAVYQGETLITSDASTLEVRFLDDTRLSQGANSRVDLDSYVYDPETPSNSSLLLELGTGVFRTMTGEIAEQNPDNFKLKSPQALIGIRGTTVVSEVNDLTERHGTEDIGEGKMLVIQDRFGNIQFISSPERVIDFFENQPIEAPRPLNPGELEYFQSTAPFFGDTTQQEQEDEPSEDDQDEDEGGGEEEQGTRDEDTGDGEPSDTQDDQDGDGPETDLFDSGDETGAEQQQPRVLGVLDVSDPEEPLFYMAAPSQDETPGTEVTEETEASTEDEIWYDEQTRPTATDNSASVTEDTDLTAEGNLIVDDDGKGVDSDPNGGELAIVSIEGQSSDAENISGKYGVLDWEVDGSYTYTLGKDVQSLGAGETVSDTFSYTLSDGQGGTDTAVLTVTINGVNDAPSDIAPNSFNVDENIDTSDGYSVGMLSSTDEDSGESFSYSIV